MQCHSAKSIFIITNARNSQLWAIEIECGLKIDFYPDWQGNMPLVNISNENF